MSLFERNPKQLRIAQNPCLENCNAACCRDIMFIGLSGPDIKKLTPKGTKVTKVPRDELSAIYDEARERNKGVYISVFPDKSFDAVLIGKCPNLQPDNKCGIYNDRPKPCGDFDVAGIYCIIRRGSRKLPPLPDQDLLARRAIILRQR